MKNVLLAAIIFIISCTKSKFITPVECQPVYFLSDKYTSDSVYKRTDTLFHDVLCGRWLDSIKAQKQFNIILCADMTIETRRYVIGNEITYPLKFKQ